VVFPLTISILYSLLFPLRLNGFTTIETILSFPSWKSVVIVVLGIFNSFCGKYNPFKVFYKKFNLWLALPTE